MKKMILVTSPPACGKTFLSAIVALALEALDCADTVLINAPFTREIRDKKYMQRLRSQLAEKHAKQIVIWIVTEKEVCHQRMIDRNSDRDTWKLKHWEEYIAGVNFDIPNEVKDPNEEGSLLLFYNSSKEEFEDSMKRVLKVLNE